MRVSNCGVERKPTNDHGLASKKCYTAWNRDAIARRSGKIYAEPVVIDRINASSSGRLTLQLALDRQDAHEPGAKPLPESRLWLVFHDHLAAVF